MVESEAFAANDRASTLGKYIWVSEGRYFAILEGGGFMPREEVIDRAFTGVVNSEAEAPIVEMRMEVAKVFGGGAGAFFRAVPLIDGPVRSP